MAAKKGDRESRARLRTYQARQAVHEGAVARRRRDNRLALITAATVIVLAASTQVAFFTVGPGAVTPAENATPAETDAPNPNAVPSPELAEGRIWSGSMEINDISLGLELDGAAAPQAVSGFIADARSGYYPGKTCHRLTDDNFSVLQCGSLDGLGGPDPDFSYGPIENAPENDFYPAGTIAMARMSGQADSNGHQFFIVYDDTTIRSDAAGGYTVIGRVTSGLSELNEKVTSAGVLPGSASSNDGPPAVTTVLGNVELN